MINLVLCTVKALSLRYTVYVIPLMEGVFMVVRMDTMAVLVTLHAVKIVLVIDVMKCQETVFRDVNLDTQARNVIKNAHLHVLQHVELTACMTFVMLLPIPVQQAATKVGTGPGVRKYALTSV